MLSLLACLSMLFSSPVEGQAVLDRLLIKLCHPAPTSAGAIATGDASLDAVLLAAGAMAMEPVFHTPPRGWREPRAAASLGLDCWYCVRLATERPDIDAIASHVRASISVACCEVERRGHLLDTVPDDPDFPSQWSLQHGKVDAPRAWDLAKSTTRVVAIIDTGVELDHQDLADNLWKNPGEIPGNGIDDDGNGYVDDVVGWDSGDHDNDPDDLIGHGTHVAGIVGASGDNARQVCGVCWSVPLMVVKVFEKTGGLTFAQAAEGIVYAADNGASVMNCSFKFDQNGSLLRYAIEYAASLDMVIVCGAGNNNNDNEVYPAAYLQSIAVIATDENDQKAYFSSYGDWCDIAAPGNHILSTYLGNTTQYISGTSMASPHVAGAAALVRELDPTLDAEGVRSVLCYSTVDLGNPGFDDRFAWGRLDLRHALESARSISIDHPQAHLGDAVTFELSQPREPGYLHLLLASSHGRSPGLSLTFFDPGDLRVLPINGDSLWFSFILSPASAGTCLHFLGRLDGQGEDRATFVIPRDPLLAGEELDFAYVTFAPWDLAHVSSISTYAHLSIQ